MKRLLPILFLLLCSLFAQAQLPTDNSGKVSYTGTVTASGQTQAQLFSKAKAWLASSYGADHVVQSEDAQSGLLTGRGVVRVKDFAYYPVIRLTVKDGQVAYLIDQITWATQEGSVYGGEKTTRAAIEQQRDSKMKMGKGLREKMLAEFDASVKSSLSQLQKEITN